MRIDKDDTKHLRRLEKPLDVEQHKPKQHKDPRHLDHGALHHSIRYIKKGIDKVTAHCQHNKGIELPESGPG